LKIVQLNHADLEEISSGAVLVGDGLNDRPHLGSFEGVALLFGGKT
jgi:hypothetical protein